MAAEILWGTKARHLDMRQSAADFSTECGAIDFTDGALCEMDRQQAKNHLWMQVPVLATKQLFKLPVKRCTQ